MLASKEISWAEVFRGLNRMSIVLAFLAARSKSFPADNNLFFPKKRLIILAMLCCAQQFSGNTLIGTYGTCELDSQQEQTRLIPLDSRLLLSGRTIRPIHRWCDQIVSILHFI